MDFDYSIERLCESINNPKTKIYFQEVYQTYVNRNYRSATVMLYSVLICDLVFKLRDMRDIYGDSKAEKILKEIEEKQVNNPTSPEWESFLISAIQSRTNLLEASHIVAIDSLQKYRHLSAHPVLSNADLLFMPNRETVQGLIRNMLEGILTSPPFFSNKVFDTMMDDLAVVKDSLYEFTSHEKYLVARYLKHLKDDDFRKVFRSLWKVVFISQDAKARENRAINFRTLFIFTRQRKTLCIDTIKSESGFYSNITDEKHTESLIHYLAKFPEVYTVLEDSLKLIIKSLATSSDSLVFCSWFIKGDIKTHLDDFSVFSMKGLINECLEEMQEIYSDNGASKEFFNFLIRMVAQAPSFEDAANIVRKMIGCFDDGKLGVEQVRLFLEAADRNGQVYESYKAVNIIEQIVEPFASEINFKNYPNLVQRCKF